MFSRAANQAVPFPVCSLFASDKKKMLHQVRDVSFNNGDWKHKLPWDVCKFAPTQMSVTGISILHLSNFSSIDCSIRLLHQIVLNKQNVYNKSALLLRNHLLLFVTSLCVCLVRFCMSEFSIVHIPLHEAKCTEWLEIHLKIYVN